MAAGAGGRTFPSMADSMSGMGSQASESMRSCIKPGCRWPAVATLSYRYATAEVWLSDLGERHPATHDLCPHHADDLRVPRGWTLVDERRPVAAYHEPSAAEIVDRVTTLRNSVDMMLTDRTPASRRSRYASLLETLPTYDAPESVPGPAVAGDEAAGHRPAPTEDPTEDQALSVLNPPTLVHVGVSHEMAPIARELTPAGGVASRSVLAQRYLDRVNGETIATMQHEPVGPEDVARTPGEGGDLGARADGDQSTRQPQVREAIVLSLPLRDVGDTDAE